MSSEMSPSPSVSASPPPSANKAATSPLAVRQLRPYQQDIALAILNSVFGRKGLTFPWKSPARAEKMSFPHSSSCSFSRFTWRSRRT